MYESVKIRTAVLLWTLWQAAAFYLLFCIVSKADSEGVE